MIASASTSRALVPTCWLSASALLAFVVAALPLLAWYGRRMSDGSDEPLGVIALVAAGVIFLTAARFGRRDPGELRILPARMMAGAAVLASLQLGGRGISPLITGVLAVAIIAASVSMPRGKAGVIALLVLSLPLIASLDFFAGYPLRLAIAEIATTLLKIGGIPVERAGVMLVDGDRLVGIDPPCAGVRMLWTACFVAAVLAGRLLLDGFRTLVLLAVAVACVVAGNGVRAALVFFPESGRVEWPDWVHPGAGLLVHGVVLLGVFGIGTRLAGAEAKRSIPRAWTKKGRLAAVALLIFMGGVGVKIAARPIHPSVAPHEGGDWPAMMEGVSLVRQPLSPHEEGFARAFPGSIAKFAWGDAEVILRRTRKPTRMMHPAADCLRAAGFVIHEEPVFRDADGRLWGASTARRDGRIWRVHERYVSANGKDRTDASSWYWQALLESGGGPWTGITIIRPDAIP